MKINFDTANLKRQVEENPVLAAGVLAALLTATAKVMDANTNRRNSHAWGREVTRRERTSRR